MRASDLDMTGPVWEYRPPRHKTEHLDNASDRLRRPAEILVETDAPLKDRLKAVTSQFQGAMQQDEWPKRLLARAESVSSKLQAVDRMDATDAGRVAKEILSLAMDVQAEAERLPDNQGGRGTSTSGDPRARKLEPPPGVRAKEPP